MAEAVVVRCAVTLGSGVHGTFAQKVRDLLLYKTHNSNFN